MMSKEDLEETTDSAPKDSTPVQETNNPAPPKPYTPSILWWTKNRFVLLVTLVSSVEKPMPLRVRPFYYLYTSKLKYTCKCSWFD